MVGVVHAKSTSTRLENINNLKIGNDELFLIALKKLRSAGVERIFLDGDCEEMGEITRKNGFYFSKRECKYADNATDGNDLIEHLLESINFNGCIIF
jgi:CMP-N-acetylneuraminic acid synthetase